MVMEGFGETLKKTFRKIARMGVVDREAVEIVVKDLQRALIQADVDVSMVVELWMGLPLPSISSAIWSRLRVVVPVWVAACIRLVRPLSSAFSSTPPILT